MGPAFSSPRLSSPGPSSSAFASFLLAGFECSSHRARGGRRLDLLAATGHDRLAATDYAALRAHGIRAARDGVRWHLCEPEPGRLDWSTLRPMLHAARAAARATTSAWLSRRSLASRPSWSTSARARTAPVMVSAGGADGAGGAGRAGGGGTPWDGGCASAGVTASPNVSDLGWKPHYWNTLHFNQTRVTVAGAPAERTAAP